MNHKSWIILICLLAAAGLILAAGLFFHHNTHWWEKDMERLEQLGVQEKQVTLPSGRVINYGEAPGKGPALLLLHGQMVSWEDYAKIIPALSQSWHVYAADLYGHGQSSHEESLYYLDTNGEDLIWFIQNVIGEKTVVSGHSNGALLAGYVAAYGKDTVSGVLLEDPPVFSTQGEGWETSFAYLDTYQPLHNYLTTQPEECWPAYYLRHCYWGQIFMKNAMPGLARAAQKYHEAHPGEEVRLMFLPPSASAVFHYVDQYDMMYGEHFYDLTWNHGVTHEAMLSDIEVPCVYLHAKEQQDKSGVALCAATQEQADRAVKYIGANCTKIETPDSNHNIHGAHTDLYLKALGQLAPKEAHTYAQ